MVAPANSPKVILTEGEPDLKIEELYAIVAVGPKGEGIMGGSMVVEGQQMMMPFVGADIARIKQIIPYAKQVAQFSGTEFKIYRFTTKTDVTDEFK